MSYILDALRKSETERRQGQVPDLGQQVQLIHRPKKKGVSPVVWVAVALVLNAAVLAYVFWPERERSFSAAPAATAADTTPSAEAQESTANPVSSPSVQPEIETRPENAVAESGNLAQSPVNQPDEDQPVRKSTASAVSSAQERATIIVPSVDASAVQEAADGVIQSPPEQAGRVPHLVELPLSFQKGIPDLTFNSHIYSSSPGSRRVMINNSYLRIGDSFQGLRVEDITEDGVVLSRDGRRFRVGVVRDWVSPR
ncbi:general secretion pathway protein B [Marinobacter gudaonensis]|uniref:General secretion pathway protein B n=1 Tax=Marinobacter gudaonensis TaxID=375760 RepID=A0A1I6GCZ1_9GAMM|nr:general secretion pathway protein GspB [Marinobacter gudaonensis]SFR40018.1 general secretion pathway protein B [Marinobacter gudaonensis]